MSTTPEFTRPVPLTRLNVEPFRQHIAADEGERAALAKRFDLVALDRLEAEVELEREAAGTFLLTATFGADFIQRCIVTLDSVADSVAEHFQLRYGPADAEGDPATGDDAPAFEPLTDDVVDIGEAVAQEFSLALPPFPRAAGAAVEPTASTATSDGPFADLARLTRRAPD